MFRGVLEPVFKSAMLFVLYVHPLRGDKDSGDKFVCFAAGYSSFVVDLPLCRMAEKVLQGVPQL